MQGMQSIGRSFKAIRSQQAIKPYNLIIVVSEKVGLPTDCIKVANGQTLNQAIKSDKPFNLSIDSQVFQSYFNEFLSGSLGTYNTKTNMFSCSVLAVAMIKRIQSLPKLPIA